MGTGREEKDGERGMVGKTGRGGKEKEKGRGEKTRRNAEKRDFYRHSAPLSAAHSAGISVTQRVILRLFATQGRRVVRLGWSEIWRGGRSTPQRQISAIGTGVRCRAPQTEKFT